MPVDVRKRLLDDSEKSSFRVTLQSFEAYRDVESDLDFGALGVVEKIPSDGFAQARLGQKLGMQETRHRLDFRAAPATSSTLSRSASAVFQSKTVPESRTMTSFARTASSMVPIRVRSSRDMRSCSLSWTRRRPARQLENGFLGVSSLRDVADNGDDERSSADLDGLDGILADDALAVFADDLGFPELSDALTGKPLLETRPQPLVLFRDDDFH